MIYLQIVISQGERVMTREKQVKIRRIKSIRIWPTVIGFLVSLSLLFGLIMAIMTLAIMYVLENQYTSKYEAAQYIAEAIQRDYKRDIPFDAALENFNPDRFCIIDKDNNVVAPEGNRNIDLNKVFEV